MTEKYTFEEVAEWIRSTYHKTISYNGKRWHPIYQEFDTIYDIIRILKQKHGEELKND